VNRLLAIILFLGTIAGVGLFQNASYQVQDQSVYGQPAGEPRIVYPSPCARAFFLVFGVACGVGCLYFLNKCRRDP
jgi:hypothetical protein